MAVSNALSGCSNSSPLPPSPHRPAARLALNSPDSQASSRLPRDEYCRARESTAGGQWQGWEGGKDRKARETGKGARRGRQPGQHVAFLKDLRHAANTSAQAVVSTHLRDQRGSAEGLWPGRLAVERRPEPQVAPLMQSRAGVISRHCRGEANKGKLAWQSLEFQALVVQSLLRGSACAERRARVSVVGTAPI